MTDVFVKNSFNWDAISVDKLFLPVSEIVCMTNLLSFALQLVCI